MSFREIIFAHTDRSGRIRICLVLFAVISASACTPQILVFTDPVTELQHPGIGRDVQSLTGARVRQVSVDPFSESRRYDRTVPENVPVAMSLLASTALPEDLLPASRDGAVVTMGGYASEAPEGFVVFDPGPAAAAAARFAAARPGDGDELRSVCLFVLETEPAARRMRSEFVSELTRAGEGRTELTERRWFTDPGTEAVRGAVRDAGDTPCLVVLFLGDRLPAALEILENRSVPVVIGGDRIDYPGVDIVGWFDRSIAEALAAWYRDPDMRVFPAHFKSPSEVSGL